MQLAQHKKLSNALAKVEQARKDLQGVALYEPEIAEDLRREARHLSLTVGTVRGLIRRVAPPASEVTA